MLSSLGTGLTRQPLFSLDQPDTETAASFRNTSQDCPATACSWAFSSLQIFHHSPPNPSGPPLQPPVAQMWFQWNHRGRGTSTLTLPASPEHSATWVKMQPGMPQAAWLVRETPKSFSLILLLFGYETFFLLSELVGFWISVVGRPSCPTQLQHTSPRLGSWALPRHKLAAP